MYACSYNGTIRSAGTSQMLVTEFPNRHFSGKVKVVQHRDHFVPNFLILMQLRRVLGRVLPLLTSDMILSFVRTTKQYNKS